MNYDWSQRNLIVSCDRISFTLLSFFIVSGSSFSSLNSSQMFSTSSSYLWCVLHRKRGNRKDNIRSCRSHRDIGTSNSESVDRVRHIVHSLQYSISVHILVTTMGDTKSILGLNAGRVDILVAKAELAKLILSMELAGGTGGQSKGGGG